MADVQKIIASPLNVLWMTGKFSSTVSHSVRTVFSLSNFVCHPLQHLAQPPCPAPKIGQAHINDMLRGLHQTTITY